MKISLDVVKNKTKMKISLAVVENQDKKLKIHLLLWAKQDQAENYTGKTKLKILLAVGTVS